MESTKSIYDTVPPADEHYESRSSTEVDESLMGDEKQWHSIELGTPERRRRSAWVSAIKAHRWLINTSLQLAILMLLVVLLFRRQDNRAQPDPRQVGGDYTGTGPIC